VFGAGVIVALGAGWFVLARFVMDEPIGDASGEALGVMLGFLLVTSIIGAIRSGRGKP
jgi:hypothetical protein